MQSFISGQLHSIGGPILAILLIVSVVATASALVELALLWRLGAGRHGPATRALALWRQGDADGALRIVAADRASLSEVVADAMATRLRFPADDERARQVAIGTASERLAAMGRHVRILETCVQAAPMLGLLGTVLGMIAAFNEMATRGGAVSPTELAGGIWVALSTTALGLAIAIPFYFFTSWLEGRIEREGAAMERAILAVLYRWASDSSASGSRAPAMPAETRHGDLGLGARGPSP